MSLTELIRGIEQDIGTFTKKYSKSSNTLIPTADIYQIKFPFKPAQQMLANLGGTMDPELNLTGHIGPRMPTPDITISGFEQNASSNLKLSKGLIEKLKSNAKIQVNTAIIPAGLYQKALEGNLVQLDDNGVPQGLAAHWQNLAVGICHVQEIAVLVTINSDKGNSIVSPREGQLNVDSQTILLLSSPILKYRGGLAGKLTDEQQTEYIQAMYRNVFTASLKENRRFITMSATGMGMLNGKPAKFFNALMAVAKEFPDLNIIYNPGDFGTQFETERAKANLANVVSTDKDPVSLALKLTERNCLCSLHNPSTSDVMYGLKDVGNAWKNAGKGDFGLEEFIGCSSTAPLNSRGFNPDAYKRITEVSLKPAAQQPSASFNQNGKHKSLRTFFKLPQKQKTDQAPTVLANIKEPEETTKPSFSLAIARKKTKTPPSQSTITDEQSALIQSQIDRLKAEIISCWPYPNKDLKQIKVDGLNLLLDLAKSLPLSDAIQKVKSDYPRLMEGKISQRTAELITKLETDSIQLTLKTST